MHRSFRFLLLAVLLLGGAALPASAQSGHALSFFPYQCKRVYVPLATPDGAFTLAAWARFHGDPEAYGFYPVMAFGDDKPFFGIGGEYLRVMGRDGLIIEAEGLPVGAWRHVAYTFDGITSRLYVGGIEVASADVAPPTGGTDMGIGCHLGDTVWPGYIDEVMVWNEARSAEQITADMGGLSGSDLTSDALLAYFKFDEGAGQVAVNAKAGGPNGVLGGTEAVEVTDPDWVEVANLPTSVDAPGGMATFQLSDAQPNPAGAHASFTLSVEQTQPVRVRVFDALGRAVTTLHDGLVAAGTAQTLAFDAEGLPGGVYFVRAEGAAASATRRIVLVR